MIDLLHTVSMLPPPGSDVQAQWLCPGKSTMKLRSHGWLGELSTIFLTIKKSPEQSCERRQADSIVLTIKALSTELALNACPDHQRKSTHTFEAAFKMTSAVFSTATTIGQCPNATSTTSIELLVAPLISSIIFC